MCAVDTNVRVSFILGTLSGKTFLRWPGDNAILWWSVSSVAIRFQAFSLFLKVKNQMRRLSSFMTPSTPHTVYQSALKSTHHWCIFIHYWSIFQLRFRCRDNKRGWRTLMVLTAFLQQNKVAQHKSLWHTLWYINGFICIKQWCLSIKWIFEGIAFAFTNELVLRALLETLQWCEVRDEKRGWI